MMIPELGFKGLEAQIPPTIIVIEMNDGLPKLNRF